MTARTDLQWPGGEDPPFTLPRVGVHDISSLHSDVTHDGVDGHPSVFNGYYSSRPATDLLFITFPLAGCPEA